MVVDRPELERLRRAAQRIRKIRRLARRISRKITSLLRREMIVNPSAAALIAARSGVTACARAADG
jgi:hypothetical protein